MKYSECLTDWLVELGYTHCFYVGGGNIMHLIESFSKKLDCRPVINEVAAGIAAEYFNETSRGSKALALVTAGPGLTNIITAMAGAYLESRELLVIGGQVKTADLARGELRQRGIQEIDGVSIAAPVSKVSELIDAPITKKAFTALVRASSSPRKGPVFLEIPLDVQARDYDQTKDLGCYEEFESLPLASSDFLNKVAKRIKEAKRPIFLFGAGVERKTAAVLMEKLIEKGIPIATTWNAADRLGADSPVYIGRPNTWGQRSANIITQQADLLVALGTRLGMQQSGFNWQQFIPNGEIIHVDVDRAELDKGHPKTDLAICAEVNDLLMRLCEKDLGEHMGWLGYTQQVRKSIPLVEDVNKTRDAYISPFEFAENLSKICVESDVVIPCSSGGAFTVMMQTFEQKAGQIMVTNKALASMGYGLSGAIGAAIANPERRTILIEGDGGFAQNLQEIGTAAINKLNLKIFIFDDSGYASIRMTQRSYFGGRYVGCDTSTGLGLPDWEKLFAAWGVPVLRVNRGYQKDNHFLAAFKGDGVQAFIVSIDPEQTYFPKITSRITETGAMESNPLHIMSPDLPEDLKQQVSIYIS
jgi:acetolactate synthase I/II/III large subunit